jgi:hypothetical protein
LLRLLGTEGRLANGRARESIGAEGERIVEGVRRAGVPTLSFLVTADTLLGWLTMPSGAVEVHRAAIGRDSLAGLVATMRRGLDVDDAATRGRLAPDGSDPGAASVRGDSRAALVAARALAAALLPNAWAVRVYATREFVVVPHGPLALIPFAALPLDRTDSTGATEPGAAGANAAWGAEFAVRQAPSLATLAEVELRDSASREGPRRFADALVAGNPMMPMVRGEDGLNELLPPLPQSGAEARSVAERLGVTPLTGAAATEAAIRARLPRAQIIHLATHGFAFASDARARDSWIALAADSTNDGLLTVGEIMDDPALRLTSDLVVLSACQSGLGELKDAEGTIGLPRAFLARGARSVLVSLWSVSDDATRLLMERFYSHWLEDPDRPSKAIALQRAATDMRATAGFEHPRFWAGFQVVGAR